MAEKKVYTEAEIEEISEKASQAAMEHFKHGLNCGECVFQGEPYNHVDYGQERTVSDIIYFASAIPSEGA